MRSKKAIVNIISLLLFQATTIICGFIVPKLIISNYGSNVNGLISSITQFLAYIVLLDSGFTAVVKSQLYKPIAENNYDKINAILKHKMKNKPMITMTHRERSTCLLFIYISIYLSMKAKLRS